MNYVDASYGVEHASRLRTPELTWVERSEGKFSWAKTFSPGEAFDRLATDFRLTPGVVA
jgi:2,3-bisphosphoglycerate-dependent phosphoglycerate mutase